jgi:hypothetical protein
MKQPLTQEPAMTTSKESAKSGKSKKTKGSSTRMREQILSEYRQELAIERFREEKPQMWLQSQRMGKLIDIQDQLENDQFPEGSCFLHANTVTSHDFCVKKITGVDLDTCQVTIEIYGDEELEGGIVVLPLETVEWFGFPAKAVPIGVHFEGFISRSKPGEAKPAAESVAANDPKAVARRLS